MEICSNGHEEIVYDNSGKYRFKCPMCELVEEIDDKDKEILTIKNELDLANDYLSEHCPEYFL